MDIASVLQDSLRTAFGPIAAAYALAVIVRPQGILGRKERIG